jgi:hypothetical protein
MGGKIRNYPQCPKAKEKGSERDGISRRAQDTQT